LVLLACDPEFRAGQSRTERLCPETLCGNLPPDRRRESAVLFQRIFEGAGDVSAVFVGFPEKDEKTDRSPRKITVSGNEIFKQDNIKPNYYSLAYEVALEGEGALGYDVSIIAPNIQGYFITDKESKENKTEFTSSENVFKIMIPSEYKDLGFEIEIKVTGKYKDEKIFRAVEYLGEGEAKEDKPNEYIIYEDGLYRKEAKSIIFTHEKTEDNENGGDKQEPESPDNGEQNEETDKKPNPDDEIQENDKIKEDIEVKETVNASISKPNVPKEEKRLPRTRK